MRELVIMGNQVTIDGYTKEVTSTLPADALVVSWHKKMNKAFKEHPHNAEIVEVNLADYQNFIDEWNAVEVNPTIPPIQPEDEETDPDVLAEMAVKNAVNAIVVDYEIEGVIYQFSGHLEAQTNIAIASMKTSGKPNKKQFWFTKDSQKVQLKGSDLTNILDLIDIEMEVILGSVQ